MERGHLVDLGVDVTIIYDGSSRSGVVRLGLD
jgi:hypothetical protein